MKYSALMVPEVLTCIALASCGGSASMIETVGEREAPAASGSPSSTIPTLTIASSSPAGESPGTAVLEGSAADDKAVLSVTWSNDRGGSGAGALSGSPREPKWATGKIPLQAGNNTITVTAVDASGNKATATAVVNSAAAAPSPNGAGPYIDISKLPAGSPGVAVEQFHVTTEVPTPSETGAFRTVCGYSHMAFDDPIVYPGQPGRSHLHAFFGNTGANANSTASTIATTGNSTCRGGIMNRSAYWVPAMIDTRDGSPVKPFYLGIYYKTGLSVARDALRTPPIGLRMIAGDPNNASPTGPFTYACAGLPWPQGRGQSIQNCPVGTELWQSVSFPQCWDGVNLDSPDHKSHMAYPVNRACPASHPVPLPEISFNVVYKVPAANASMHWRLASDSYDASIPAGYSAHGDWFNGWKPEVIDTWVKKCDQASKDCHSHLLGDGRAIY